MPPPPPGFPNAPFPPPPPGFSVPPPPPPPGFPGVAPPPGGYTPAPAGLFNSLPPPPPGFFPRHGATPIAQTSGSRASIAHATKAPLPAAPAASTATVSAEAQLRDFKKESTAFVPASLQRRRAAPGGAGSGRGAGNVNSAPALDGESNGQARDAAPARPDLVSTLRGQFGSAREIKAQEKPKVKDDYEKFVEGMGDILGPSLQ
jgi:hypothetical protein